MRFRIEHYRAVDVPGSALGYQFAPTGRVEEVDAHDEEDAAAMARTVAGDEPDADGPVAYDPGSSLYAVPGDDEAVRVTPVEAYTATPQRATAGRPRPPRPDPRAMCCIAMPPPSSRH